MKCPECGTEIAEKALICFRCGASMYQPVHKPAPLRTRKRPVIVYIVFAILVLAAIAIVLFR